MLKGGISADSGLWLFSLFSTDALFGGCPGTAGEVVAGLVFGTLLGPEATGPGLAVVPFAGVAVVSGVCLFLVSWLHRSCMVGSLVVGAGVWGVWFGVVV